MDEQAAWQMCLFLHIPEVACLQCMCIAYIFEMSLVSLSGKGQINKKKTWEQLLLLLWLWNFLNISRVRPPTIWHGTSWLWCARVIHVVWGKAEEESSKNLSTAVSTLFQNNCSFKMILSKNLGGSVYCIHKLKIFCSFRMTDLPVLCGSREEIHIQFHSIVYSLKVILLFFFFQDAVLLHVNFLHVYSLWQRRRKPN